jgi:tetratricopeptide (TPR) repeat protein
MTIVVSASVLAALFAAHATVQDSDWAGNLRRAQQAEAGGRYMEAIALLRQTVALTDKFGPGDERTWATYNSLANVYEDAGFPADSMHVYRQTMGMVKAAVGEQNIEYARLLANLATVYVGSGDMVSAENMLREALQIERQLTHPDPVEMALLKSRLAGVLAKLGRYAEAERMIGVTLPVLEGAEDTMATATTLSTLGMVRSRERRYGESLEAIGKAVAILEKKFGPDNPVLIRPLSAMAEADTLAGRKEDAGAAFRRAIAICEKSLPPGHPSRAALLAGYARYLRATGERARAKTVEAQARSLAQNIARRDGMGMTVDVSELR